MTINKKIEKYLSEFEHGKRNDGSGYVFIKNHDWDNPDKLMIAVRSAHGDKMPDDWIYSTFHNCLQRLSDYEITDNDKLEDIRSEAVDSMVDIYTADLTKWLASNINNVYYLTQAIEEFECKDGFKALSMAQYIAIDEVMNEVINLLES